ncbi:MAG TPA: SpoIIE family protein phosphatase [Polyangiaceae bacterium]|nr:SpoIIE family protein phosphatase [Polyangiaceae bacterium]
MDVKFAIPRFLEGSFGDAVPEIENEQMLAQAEELLAHLSHALFPSTGDVPIELMTWADGFLSGRASEESPRSIEDRLKAAEARFVTLVEQIPAVTFMAVLGEGENEVYVSPHIEQMLGYSQEEWLSDPFLWYRRLHPDDRALWNQEFAEGCRRGGPFRAECRFLARDGRIVWVHGEARLVRDERGRPQFLQGVAFDITESKRAQQVVLENAVRTAKVQEELEIARRMQTSILPAEPSLDGLEVAALMIPADEVGGDYYDVRPALDGGWITIGDVSGHGLDAGLVMLMVQSAAFGIASARSGTSPAELLTLLNEVLYDNIARRLGRSDYVTLCVLRYRRNGLVEFAGAHQDIIVCRAATGSVERVRTQGPWVGIRKQIRTITTDGALQLRDGDILVLYTDGIIEAMNADGEQFDVPRLCAAIHEARTKSVEEIRDHVVARARAWMATQDDDLTLLVARYRAP